MKISEILKIVENAFDDQITADACMDDDTPMGLQKESSFLWIESKENYLYFIRKKLKFQQVGLKAEK